MIFSMVELRFSLGDLYPDVVRGGANRRGGDAESVVTLGSISYRSYG